MRDVLAVLIGLAVVAAVGYVGWGYLSEEIEPDAPEPVAGEDAGATAAAYLAAWEAWDLDAMAALVREPPEDFAERHRQLTAAWSPTSVRVTGGEMVSNVDGRAFVPVTVTVELDEISSPVSWDSQVDLSRIRGSWAVDWAMTTLHPELRPTWVFARSTEDIDREPILAADGTPLAGGDAAVVFGFRPGSVTDPDEVIEAFAEAIPGSEVAAERELSRDDLVEDWFYPVVTVSGTQAEVAAPRLPQSLGILRRESSDDRALLEAGFARHVVGVVAEATAEQLEELGDAAEPGIRIAQFGLEAVFDDQLTGSEIIRFGLREQGIKEEPLRVVIGEGQADPSSPLQTTLEVDVQRAVETALADVDGSAAFVVVDGETGAIRASASRPLTGFNRAFSGRYPPGSTFKLVTAEALVGSGLGPDDEVSCPAETTVGGLRVPNAAGRAFGTTTFRTAFDESCNTTFATLGAELGSQALEEAAARFGFGVDPLVPLDAFGGSFPAPADDAEVGAAAFGQARVEASPLHLASVAGATVTGVWRQPFLIAEDGPGESRPLATGTPDVLRSLLRSAVTDGTGSAADVGGQEVGGKTGTAQAQDGVEHAWFIGTFDGLGFAILVEGGGSGSDVAAPIAGRFVEALVALRREDASDDEGDAADTDDGEGQADEADGATPDEGGSEDSDDADA